MVFHASLVFKCCRCFELCALSALRENHEKTWEINGFSRLRALDTVWKSCQSIELATAKMCAAKGSIYAAL